jgi:ABC-2 type transport system permease protein
VIFMVPLLTMKCLAEERRLGTIETLLTTPVTTTEVVLGKYGAAYLLYLAFWASTGGLFYILKRFAGDPRLIDPGPISAATSSSPSRASSSSRSASSPAPCRATRPSRDPLHHDPHRVIFGGRYLGSAAWLDREALAPLKAAVTTPDLASTFEDFTRGVVDTRELLFYVSGTVLALIFSILSVEAKLLHS